MKAIVTGGAGFIGSHLVDRLINEGWEVVVIDNLINGSEKFVNKQATLWEVDIRDIVGSHDTIENLFRDFKPDYVFHLAAVSQTPWAIKDPLYTYSTNVFGSAKVLEASRIANVSKVVLASSNIVYASQTPYKSSKLAMEMVARDYSTLYNLPTLCLRFSNVYGSERQHEANVLASLAKSKRDKGKIFITGDGKQTRNFTHVEDICTALITAALSPVSGDEIDIVNPTKWSLNDIAKFFNCPVEYIADRKGDIKHLVMEQGPERAKELLGFEAKMELPDYIQVYTK